MIAEAFEDVTFRPYALVAVPELPAIVRRFIEEGRPIGVDVEATGLDPWSNRLITLQLGDEHGVSIADLRHMRGEDQESLTEAVPLLLGGGCELQGHNLKYDCLVLAVACGFGPDDLHSLRVYDSMLAAQVILGGVDAPDGSGRERASLGATAARYGVDLSKEARSWFIALDQRPDEWQCPLPDEQLA